MADYQCVREGKHRIDWQPNPKTIGKEFPFRDYFLGAMRHEGEVGRATVHISRVFQAVSDRYYKFAISAPVHEDEDPQSRFLGVVVVAITTGQTLGPLQLKDSMAVLVGCKDIDINSPNVCKDIDINPPNVSAFQQAGHLIVVHPAYRPEHRDIPIPVVNHKLQSVHKPQRGKPEIEPPDDPKAFSSGQDMDDDYQDPLGEQDAEYKGRMLAGFAPVGNTQLAVIVQQRYDRAIEPGQTLVRNLILSGGILLSLGIIITGAAIGADRQRIVYFFPLDHR